jgi:hypothetical protein
MSKRHYSNPAACLRQQWLDGDFFNEYHLYFANALPINQNFTNSGSTKLEAVNAKHPPQGSDVAKSKVKTTTKNIKVKAAAAVKRLYLLAGVTAPPSSFGPDTTTKSDMAIKDGRGELTTQGVGGQAVGTKRKRVEAGSNPSSPKSERADEKDTHKVKDCNAIQWGNAVVDFYAECLRAGQVLLGHDAAWSNKEKLVMLKSEMFSRFSDWYRIERRSGKYKADDDYGHIRFWIKMHHLAIFESPRPSVGGTKLRQVAFPPLNQARKNFTQKTNLVP